MRYYRHLLQHSGAVVVGFSRLRGSTSARRTLARERATTTAIREGGIGACRPAGLRSERFVPFASALPDARRSLWSVRTGLCVGPPRVSRCQGQCAVSEPAGPRASPRVPHRRRVGLRSESRPAALPLGPEVPPPGASARPVLRDRPSAPRRRGDGRPASALPRATTGAA